jgi:hypothetical protein
MGSRLMGDRPLEILPTVPDCLATGDVCAVLALCRDDVRHAVRMDRLPARELWGYYSHRTYPSPGRHEERR